MGPVRQIATGLLVAAQAFGAHSADFDPLQYVDQLIGSANGGNVFPGATVPYGMAKAVADTSSGSNQGGFTMDGSPITGFSLMHDSGTGGSPSLGNFAMFPYANCKDVNSCQYPKKQRGALGSFVNSSVVAKPGYFSVDLDSGTKVDMTTTAHASLFRFKIPTKAGDVPTIIQDLTDLSDSRQDNGTVTVHKNGRMTGGAIFLPSFGSGNYTLYFCTDFHGAKFHDNGIIADSRGSTDVKTLKISRSINGYPLPGMGFTQFESSGDETTIIARSATSFISIEQACKHAEAEIPDFDFAAVQKAARDTWAEKLSPVVLSTEDGVDDKFRKNFYSGVYRTMVQPQNYTHENPQWDDGEPYFDSFYCIWDLFRSQLPWLTITDPETVTQVVRSLISTYEHEGWLPDCRMSQCKGFTQGGSNADNVIVDAYVKGLRGGINWDKAYEAVVHDAEVEPYDWSVEGRGGLDSWKKLGYIPVQDFDYKGFGTLTRSVSRTLEYSYNDFCISQLAHGLGKHRDQRKYIDSSNNWQNLYKKDETSSMANGQDTGFKGFFQPRYLNETWGYQDPLKCSNLDSESVCSLQNSGPETFESSIWEYNFFVPHAMAELMKKMGGPDEFVKRLDYLHDQDITYIGNEPAFLTVFQYHYAGRPALSAKRSHFYIPKYFDTTFVGLPGNDDSGTMGAFVAFSMIGLFPNPGQDVYLIIPPYFRDVSIKNPQTGKTAKIRNVNFDPTYKCIYIQSATLNGKPYHKNWLDHSFFTEGKELVLTLGCAESRWGTHVRDLPPSLGHYTGFNGTIGNMTHVRRDRYPDISKRYEPKFDRAHLGW